MTMETWMLQWRLPAAPSPRTNFETFGPWALHMVHSHTASAAIRNLTRSVFALGTPFSCTTCFSLFLTPILKPKRILCHHLFPSETSTMSSKPYPTRLQDARKYRDKRLKERESESSAM
ncbi:hypothetical protein M758_UG050500 [Ceratodon purpureus]|nr:hypothetical protein M758_UG050500 [Ceratodon purpureus]